MTLEDPAERGFTTDQDDVLGPADGDGLDTADGHDPDALLTEPGAATVIHETTAAGAADADLSMLDERPAAGRPHDYRFPRFERLTLSNGLTVIYANVPGRALLAGQLFFSGGAWAEPPELAGVTVLTGRAMPEGTTRRDALEFIEASERLGAEIHADATWETLSASVEVPRSRFGPALELLAEMVAQPAFPGAEVDRLRDERLNDLMQAWADPRRRVERVFPETIYDAGTPYSRPLGGVQDTVSSIDRDAVAERHRLLLDPSVATLVVAGDLVGVDVAALAEQHLGGLAVQGDRPAARSPEDARPAPGGPRVVLVDRPGAPQSELRIGHVGVPRKNPDFHAISVLNAILGGMFNSRLNMVIREQLGYSYGIGSAFDMRRRSGPFVIRTAVESRFTVPAILEILRIVRAFRGAEVESHELTMARDYLAGVFPLRYESSAQVAAALSGLVIFDLPDDELDRYRPQVLAVSAGDVLSAAIRHIKPDELSVVVVGDAAQVEASLRDAGLGELTVIPDEVPAG